MLYPRTIGILAALATVAPAAIAAAQTPAPVSKSEKPLLDVAADPLTGKIIATFPKAGPDGISARYIYLTQLETGLGSAPIGLDRATPNGSRILVFRRVGKKVAAEIENAKFVASTGTAEEQRAVRESFANSTVWLGDVVATKPDGSFTVDLASFLARDDLGVPAAIKRGGGGTYKFAPELSAADPNFVRLFPNNAEFAARLTFRSDEPTAEVSNIIPDNDSVGLVLRHSLIRLPEPGYIPRTDPFGYTIARQRVDFSAPLGSSVVRDVAVRFRLEKVDPSAPRSPVKKPIIFYIDRGAPEPMRTALREGVSWWNQAFEAAGFVDAFRVDILPEGADALDVRYNVVNWVNRATRGWSYGAPIDDPRTGEIIKGSVLLGSLRARQDMLIFQALVGAGLTGSGGPNDPVKAMLARLRQLGAHEVGHAIGLSHNMAASSQGRYSVMDYPAPRVVLDNGAPSLRDAYGAGIGEWDKFAVRWLYSARTDAEAAAIQAQGRAAGLRFVADNDSRPVSSAHPSGAIWDDFGEPIGELRRMMQVRQAALQRFGLGSVASGESQAGLRRSFVPIWLLHRYQLEAAAKSLGGVDYPYALSGEGVTARIVPAGSQWAALYALLDTLSPAALAVPNHLIALLSTGFGGNPDRQTDIEIIPTAGGPVFDPLKATEVGAAHTLDSVLNAERLNRLEAQHSADPGIPSPGQLADLLLDRTLQGAGTDTGRRIATTAILALARVQRSAALSPTLGLQFAARLERLAEQLKRRRGRGPDADWARGLASLLEDREALDKAVADPARLPRVPPGMPI